MRARIVSNRMEDARALVRYARRRLPELIGFHQQALEAQAVSEDLRVSIKIMLDVLRSALDYCSKELFVRFVSAQEDRDTYFPIAKGEANSKDFPSAISDNMVDDVIRQGHATAHVCPSPDRERATAADGRPALAGCLCAPPLPDRARQRPGRAGANDCPFPGLLRPVRAQRDPSLRRPRTGSARAPFHPAPHQQRGVPASVGGATAGTPPPEPAHLWPQDQPLDLGVGRQGQLRPGPDPAAGQRGNDPRDAAPTGRQVEARQELDHQPRPRV